MKQLLSEITSAGQLRLRIADVPEPELAAHEVLIRVEATPINPSDLGLLLGPVDVSTLRREGDATVGDVPAAHMAGMAARLGEAMPVGNEGGGVVVAAGSSPAAQALIGHVVGAVGGAMYGEFRAVPAQSCLAMPDGVTPAQAASPFVNPLTALSMVENMRLDGHTALVHTAAASNLGQMLVKICLADGVGLVNIVRRPEQVALLRSIGAEHVCDSSSPTFDDDLVAALTATGATLAFDATGGGTLAARIIAAMERSANSGAAYSRYGSSVHKQVFIYGRLDTRPLEMNLGATGFAWGVAGWLLTPFIGRMGPERFEAMKARVVSEITTTFASHYSSTISLEQACDPDTIRAYAAKETGTKYLITPHAS